MRLVVFTFPKNECGFKVQFTELETTCDEKHCHSDLLSIIYGWNRDSQHLLCHLLHQPPTQGLLSFRVGNAEPSIRLHSYKEVWEPQSKATQTVKKGGICNNDERDGTGSLTRHILVCSGNDLQLAAKVRQRMFPVQVIISCNKCCYFTPRQLALSSTPAFTIFPQYKPDLFILESCMLTIHVYPGQRR